jgi:class 3 adenylate cyclase/tetratricopeptide (TPR) repeat protein
VAEGTPEHSQVAAPDDDTGTRDTGRERKIATLLFADLVGFTRMNEEHDPELVSSLTTQAFERLSREVHRYEGTIEKFAGDALLAVFGVPVVHEDDPERAVRAALEMQAVMSGIGPASGDRPDLALRIGIETGEVLVDLTRAADERDMFVTGDAVNTAARLQASAASGSVVVGPSTYAASRDVLEYEEMPVLELKGKAAPVAAWRAVSVKASRGGRHTPLGLEAPLVGREAEIALLKETVRRTVADARPHLITVIGSAGVGKSRLTWELEKYLDGLPEVYHWRKGRCLAYAGLSFGPIVDVVKSDARIKDDDAPDAAREKLRARLSELPLSVEDFDAVRDALEAVLAIGDQRERPREELFESWRRYLGAIAAVDPLVLVVEDVHWADDGVLSFLDFLARWGEGPMVILCLARHELLETRSAWGGGLPNAATIVLEPLVADASAALMDGLVGGGVPAALRDRIISLAEGNPLFTEEMVRMFVDQGALRFSDGRWELVRPVAEIDIPDSVHAVLAARLDSLPGEEKRVAQDAAVVGRIFWDTIVAHLAGGDSGATGDLLRRLRVKDLVVPRRPSSLAAALEFGFRHVLIRDVAYDSLPKRDRANLHVKIALWAEAELADRIDEFAELIASHLAAALAFEEEFSVDEGAEMQELRELTQVAALRAARRASAMSQLAPAGRWYRTAIAQAAKLGVAPREFAALADEYAKAEWTAGDPADREAVMADAVVGLLTLSDPTPADRQLLASLRSVQGTARYETGDVDGARALLREGIAALEPGSPSPGRAQLLASLGWTYWRAGPVEEATPWLERAIQEAEASADAETLRWAKHDLGIAYGSLGRFDDAVRLLEESYRLAQVAEDRNLLLRCYINLPSIRSLRGDDLPPLVSMIEEGLSRARRAAADNTIAWLACNQAEHMVELGRLDAALAYLDEAVAASTAAPLRAHMYLQRANVHRLRGDIAAADRVLSEAEELSADVEPQVAAELMLGRAWARWPDDPRSALEALALAASDPDVWDDQRVLVAHELARMALRLDDLRALQHALELHQEARPAEGPRLRHAEWRWLDGLADDTAGLTAEAAAAELEGLGFKLKAADAWADAALMAARSERASAAPERAIALIEEIGLHPLLGPLPETRWLEKLDASEAASDT